jgi:hypothetical protein
MRMSPISLLTSVFHSLLTTTSELRKKPARLLVLLGCIGIAAAALASSGSSAGSLGQLLLAKVPGPVGLSQPRAALSIPATSALSIPRLNLTLPQTGSADLSVARRGHTATRLSDGRVLIAGGENGSGALNQCEIFDPAAGTFSAAGNLGAARSDHSATSLSDGRVLITGGRDGVGLLNTTEIFDPSTGTFANGSAMSVVRAGHSATLFADGRILIAGGDAGGSAEIFDPSSGTFSAVGAGLNTARSMHSAALLADGRVLLVGGRDSQGNALNTGEIFDPAGPSFTDAGSMEDARVRPTTRVLSDGKLQIIGGNDHTSMEIYDPANQMFGAHAHVLPDFDDHPDLIAEIMKAPTRAALFHNGQSDPLLDRTGQTITELPESNRALVAGGIDSDGNTLSSASVLNSSPASVTTNRIDYPPGMPAIVTGSGFQPNEMVDLSFHEDPHTETELAHEFTIQADADGNFIFDGYAPEEQDAGITYILGVKGQSSGWTAQTTLKDNVTVTAATGGTNISADKAANATSPQFTTLTDIVITEGANGDFPIANGKTLILTAPSGWQFNSGVGSATAAKVSGMGPNEVSVNSISVTTSNITVNYDVTAAGNINKLTISGIQVRATDGANITSAVNIFRTSGNPGTATIAGITNGTTNFGTLSQVVGVVSKLVVTLPNQTFTDASTVAASGNSGTVINETAGVAFNISKLTATDQFFNIVTTYSGAKTISYSGPGTNAGFPAPSYTTAVTFASGQSTTTLATTLRKAETTTITASDGSTTGPASSSLTVNPGSLSSFAVTNTSDGNIGTQTAGTAFNIKVRAVDAGGNTVISFSGGSDKVTIDSVPSGNLSAGGGTSPAFTNGVLSPYSVTFSTLGTYPGTFSITVAGDTGGSGHGVSGTSNTFTVNAPACTTPSVTTQPTNQTVTYGAASVSFAAAASGTPTPTVLWQSSPNGSTWTNITGATSTTFTINSPIVAQSGTQYRAVFTNSCGTVNSSAATLTVNKATPVITWNNPADITYGTALSGTQLNATADVAGGFVYTPASGAVLNAGNGQNLHVNFTPTDTANYNSASKDVIINVSQASSTVTVTCTAGAPYTYTGSAQTPCTAAATGVGMSAVDVTSSLVYSNNTNAGAATAQATWTGDTNHTGNTGNGGFTIGQASSTVTVTAPDFTYNGLPYASGSASVSGAGELSQSLPIKYIGRNSTVYGPSNTAPTAIGDYTAQARYMGDANHNESNNSANFTIHKKTATWTTNPNSKFWGQSDPNPLTIGSGSGFVAADGVSATYTRATGTNVGTYHIDATLSSSVSGALNNYTITNNGNTFTINPDPTAITLDIKISGTNFDCLNDQYTATLKDTVTNTGLSSVQLTLTIGSQSNTATTNNGVATFTLDLNQPPGSVTESVGLTAAWSDPNRTAPLSPVSRQFTILADPNVGPGIGASTLYTGSRFFWTTSSTSSTATLTLTATIRDKFPCGATDITKANVSFWISSNGGTSFSLVSNGQNLPLGLVDPTDKSTGTASIISQYNLGKNLSAQLWVKVTVGGEYVYSGDEFDVPVTVAVPGQLNSMLAGGSLTNDGVSLASILTSYNNYFASGFFGAGNGTTSGGIQTGSVDFGGQVTYTKSLTNPQGQLTLFIRSFNKPDGTTDGAQHTYFVKSNSIAGLALVGVASNPKKTASFSSKTNVYELVGSNRNGLDGGGVMQFMFTEPGGTYEVSTGTGSNKVLTCPSGTNGCASVIVYKSTGGVWFSSAWGPVTVGGLPQTVEKTMTAGGTYIQ